MIQTLKGTRLIEILQDSYLKSDTDSIIGKNAKISTHNFDN